MRRRDFLRNTLIGALGLRQRLEAAGTSMPKIRISGITVHRIREQMQQELAAMDQLLTHEMAHVAQNYNRPIIGRWLMWAPDMPAWWQHWGWQGERFSMRVAVREMEDYLSLCGELQPA